MILVSARNTAQEWESIFLHRLCLERPVECFQRGSLVKTFSFCDIFFLATAEFSAMVTHEHRAPEAVQAAVIEPGGARTRGPGRTRQRSRRRDVGTAWLSSLKRTH